MLVFSPAANHFPLIRFWIRDNGPGLTPEEQGRLFRSFERLDQVRAKGHGLGLSIVRRIVEKPGGEVGVESEPGQGSIFWGKTSEVSRFEIVRVGEDEFVYRDRGRPTPQELARFGTREISSQEKKEPHNGRPNISF
jgi:hypothetical protein